MMKSGRQVFGEWKGRKETIGLTECASFNSKKQIKSQKTKRKKTGQLNR